MAEGREHCSSRRGCSELCLFPGLSCPGAERPGCARASAPSEEAARFTRHSPASPQGTLIQHLKEHILHGNMTSSDIILYYTTVSAGAVLRWVPSPSSVPLPGRALVHSGREAFILTLLFASPPLHMSVARSAARAAGSVHQTPGRVRETPGRVRQTPGSVHEQPLLWDPSLLLSFPPSRRLPT